MAKDLGEALTNIETKLGGTKKPYMDLGEHLEYIESLIGGGEGARVIPNPELSGDEPALTGLQVNEDKFKVVGEPADTSKLYVEIKSDEFDYIYDEVSWNKSFASGVLRAYYDKYPDEDLWNPTEHRPANFNDKVYEVELYDDTECTHKVSEGSYQAAWISGDTQKISASGQEYFLNMFYSLDDEGHELFTDSAKSVSANLFAKFLSISFPGCTQCWEGAWKAPGAQFPWICPNFDYDANAKIIFSYKGKEAVKPWGDTFFGTSGKIWGIASVAKEFQDNAFLIELNKDNGNPAWEHPGEYGQFDVTKFKLILKKYLREDE